MPRSAINLSDLSFAWPGGPEVLRLSSLSVARGEKVFLRGPSGSGKSTLLGLLSGVLLPGAGEVELLGERIDRMPGAARDKFRAAHLGIIFQMFNLLPYLSLIDNVTMPCRFSAKRRQAALESGGTLAEEARRLLRHLGLHDEAMLKRDVTELSVGQQQRVAAARALIGRPEIVIADEPTSALDADAQARFLDLLMEECTRAGAALVFVSHDGRLATHFDRVLDLAEMNEAAQMDAGAAS